MQHPALPGRKGAPHFNTMGYQHQFYFGPQPLDDHSGHQQVHMAQQQYITVQTLPYALYYKTCFAVPESGIFCLRKIQVPVCRIAVAMHAEYLHAAAVLLTKLVQRLTRHPAHFFYPAGGGEYAKGEKEYPGFDGWLFS